MGAPLVFDVNVLVNAVLPENNPAAHRSNDAYNALLVVNQGDYSSLWLSNHILDNVFEKLVDKASVPEDLANQYTWLLQDMADETNGGIIANPPRNAFESEDYEDNHILDLVNHGSCPFLVTSNVADFPPVYRERTLVKRPHEFVEMYERNRIVKLDAARNRPSRPELKSRFDQLRQRIAARTTEIDSGAAPAADDEQYD